jgi:hypothetical protein
MRKQKIDADGLELIINNLVSGAPKINIYGIEIKDKVVRENVSITAKFPIHFKDCIFLGKFTYYENASPDNIHITHCYFLEGIHLYDPKLSKRILFSKCKIKGNFIVSGEINHLACYATSIDNFIISSAKINFLELGGKDTWQIKSLSLLDENEIKRIQISNTIAHKLSFSYLAATTELFNCSVNSIVFTKVRNDKNLKLLNCKALRISNKKSHFIVTESNLGKAEFFQFDFASYSEVNIINSILIECLFVNTTWSNNITTFFGDQMDNYLKDRIINKNRLNTLFTKKVIYKETKQQLKDKREVFKQIKYALSKQGDQINEQMFHAFEMNTYNRVLEWKSKSISTKIILYLSSITSQYGQSLLRPILFLIIANSILITLLTSYYHNNFILLSEFSTHAIISNISTFLWFSNPFHKADSLEGIPLIIDISVRIISSYSIYNIIRATRRFIK